MIAYCITMLKLVAVYILIKKNENYFIFTANSENIIIQIEKDKHRQDVV